MTIQQTLHTLGLNEKEVRVYLLLLKHGKSKPSKLAGFAKLNRATLYNVAHSLVAKGIIAEDVSGKVLHFVPLPPKSLSSMLEPAKRDLQEKERLIKKAVDELRVIAIEKTQPVPTIQFIEEARLERFLFANLMKWQDAVLASDGVWWGYQDQSFTEAFPKWLDQTWRTVPSKDPRYRAQFFSNASPSELKLGNKYPKSKRVVRSLPGTNFTANTWVCGDYLVMIVTNQHPFYLVELHDPMLAHNTREVFRQLWDRMVS